MDELEQQQASEQWWARPTDDGQWVIMSAHRDRLPGQRWTSYRETQRSAPLPASEALAVLRHLAARTPLPA